MAIDWPSSVRPTFTITIGFFRRPGEVGAELLERVEVRVRSEQTYLTLAHELVEPGLELLAVRARLGEPGREDDRECGLPLQHFFECVDGLAGEDDGEVEITGHVEHAGVAALAEHR